MKDLDPPQKAFLKGTLIITDPCYLYPPWNYGTTEPDDRPIFGAQLKRLAGWSASTLYGDWSCTTFRFKKKYKDTPIDQLSEKCFYGTYGGFCADGGRVGAYILEDVCKINPNLMEDRKDRRPLSDLATIIPNFEGFVEYIIHESEKDSPEVFVRGKGSHNFITRQTGF